ncbi:MULTISPECIES: hypothetical protein [Nocardiopsis]|uniref:Uncharacterized protein n=1 Tax=Nocardiopsis sinuspersici TaxID=501010 RepID=A0A1V3BW87_9ACTN|nr:MULTISPECIES: hypothetical protein [Nocardiopsis]OOC52436.1 hypothetical protein NOSIN_00125 [Nocardiopsis sinuspersici]
MKKTEDEYLHEHRTTVAYDVLKDTVNSLKARYIALGRAAVGDPEAQEQYNARMREVRDEVLRVDPRDLQAVTDLTERYGTELRELRREEG